MFGQGSFPEFVCSGGMGAVLFFAVNGVNFLYGYILIALMLAAYGQKVSPRRICLAVFLRYCLAQSLLIYVPGALVAQDVWRQMLPFLTTPNPAFALLYYFLCVSILRLSKYRTVHMILVLYLCSLFSYCFFRFVQYAFFPETPGPCNHLPEVLALCVSALLFLAVFLVGRPFLRRKKIAMVLTDSLVMQSLPRKLAMDFLLGSAAYGLAVTIQMSEPGAALDMLELTIIFALGMAVGLYRVTSRANRTDIQNKNAHINLLSATIDQFRGIKHDFYNMLSAYGGFISVGKWDLLRAYHEKLLGSLVSVGDQMDLDQRLYQNPALVALIVQKVERANQRGVHLRVNLLCNIQRLYIEDLSICRVLGNLLDNAVEAALETEAKRASLLMEPKPGGSILIVVTNTTSKEVDLNAIAVPGMTTKPGHNGLGLVQVRSILAKCPNCALRFEYYDFQFSAYVELFPIPSEKTA